MSCGESVELRECEVVLREKTFCWRLVGGIYEAKCLRMSVRPTFQRLLKTKTSTMAVDHMYPRSRTA